MSVTRKKKVMILSVTAGNAHNATAKAMKDKLQSMEDVDVEIVNLFGECSTPWKDFIIDKGYNLVVGIKFLLPFYNLSFRVCRKRPPYTRYVGVSQRYAKSCCQKLLQRIYDYQPDLIYCTHFYGAMAVTDLKLRYDIPAKLFVTSLDYVNSAYWESCIGADYFNVPNEDFVEENLAEGFSREQMTTFGIPVKDKFFEVIDKKEAKKSLGLDPDIFTIMVMFGGGHWKGGMKMFKQLVSIFRENGRQVQIVMINGRDEASYKKIERMEFPDNVKVVNVGFTDKVDVYMSASDVAVSKMGGASCTEMINKCVPIIATTNLPAQEQFNLEYLTAKGVALPFNNKKELRANVMSLIDDEARYNQMIENFAPLRKDAINGLAQLMLSQPMADYSDINMAAIDYSRVHKVVKKAAKEAYKKEKREALGK